MGDFPWHISAKTAAGLEACFLAGIPFFWTSLAGDALYAALLFGGMALAERKFPSLKEAALAANLDQDF